MSGPTTRAGRRARPGSKGLGLALCALLGGACTAFPQPKVWNLRQVHYPDGRAKYVGDLRWDIEYMLVTAFSATPLGTPEFVGNDQSAIKDPFKACLENLNELSDCNEKNPKTRAVMAEMYAWLGGDCTYALSRERCAIELGKLGQLAGIEGPLEPGADVVAATAEELGQQLPQLYDEASPLVAGKDSPGARQALAARCRTIEALTLDRDGARRVLQVTNLLLSRWRAERHEGIEPLLALHLEMEKLCLALTLGEMLSDDNPRVRAAAFFSAIQATNNRSPELLARTFQDRAPEVTLAGMRALERFGAPRPSGIAPAQVVFQAERFWIERIIQYLGAGATGQGAVAACRAMERLTGRSRDLHPESWIVWWEDQGRQALGGQGPPQGSG